MKQETPIRVLHRRSNDTRPKIIHSMSVTPVNETMFKLDVITSAGTYVKELVHGDFGRTQPNLRVLLGCDIDIAALDVEQVMFEWPPEVDKSKEKVAVLDSSNGHATAISRPGESLKAELTASLSSSRCLLGKRERDQQTGPGSPDPKRERDQQSGPKSPNAKRAV